MGMPAEARGRPSGDGQAPRPSTYQGPESAQRRIGIAFTGPYSIFLLAFGIVSRIASGFLADRIGGLATLLIGSLAQGTALSLYLFFESLPSLYVISALFGLFQGGIVPSYAIIVREYFSPKEAGTRVGIVIMMTVFGMAFGGWVTGWIFDMTGSYHIAFIHGVAWNVLNAWIAAWLLMRLRSHTPRLAAA